MLSITEQHWEKASTILREIIEEGEYQAWFRTLDFDSYNADTNVVTLRVETDFYRRWLSRKYMEQILAVLEDSVGTAVQLKISTVEELEVNGQYEMSAKSERSQMERFDYRSQMEPSVSRAIETKSEELNRYQSAFDDSHAHPLGEARHNLNPRYTFSEFVVGESNRYAHAASQSVADPDSNAFNPLFIYGQSGLGKTHLMQAIGQKYARQKKTARILYVTSEQFINAFIESINSRTSSTFRNLYRTVDVLLIDDVQFFIGKERTQDEIFHTFNDLFDAGKKIVLTSDRPPKEFTTLEDRLRSRFEWGVIADIAPPDLETRIAILRQKATMEKLPITDEVISHIAECVSKNIRELEGALKQIKVYAGLHNCPITLSVAEDVLRPLMNSPQSSKVSIDHIQNAVCSYFAITSHQLLGNNRSKKFSYPRHVALYLSRELTDLSFPDIAQKFGGKDHTSVIYACRKIKLLMEKDSASNAAIQHLSESIQNKQKHFS
ncbi:MAG: chromosomal replication initiator protein DnaA [Sumerlaeia bacterium]